MQFGMVLWRIYWTPVPLHLETSASRFSEARALRHVQTLAGEIGERQVSVASAARPNLDGDVQYNSNSPVGVDARIGQSRSVHKRQC